MLPLIRVTRLGGRVASAAPRREFDVGTPIGILGALALSLFEIVLEGVRRARFRLEKSSRRCRRSCVAALMP